MNTAAENSLSLPLNPGRMDASGTLEHFLRISKLVRQRDDDVGVDRRRGKRKRRNTRQAQRFEDVPLAVSEVQLKVPDGSTSKTVSGPLPLEVLWSGSVGSGLARVL